MRVFEKRIPKRNLGLKKEKKKVITGDWISYFKAGEKRRDLYLSLNLYKAMTSNKKRPAGHITHRGGNKTVFVVGKT